MSGAGHSDYLEFYRRSSYAPYLREHRSAGTAPIRILKIAQPAGHYPDEATPDLTLQMAVRDVCAQADVGAGVFRGRLNPGDLLSCPANVPADYLLDDKNAFVVAAIPFGAIRPLLEEGDSTFNGDFGRLHSAPFRDDTLAKLLQCLWYEARAGNSYGSMFAEGAILALSGALLRAREPWSAHPSLSVDPLSSGRLRRAEEFIRAHHAEDIGVAEAAHAAALSPAHFAREFRAAFGVPPHEFLISVRVERACELLSDGTSRELSLAQIAEQVGFFDQSHLTRHFKRLVGVTPAAHRTAL